MQSSLVIVSAPAAWCTSPGPSSVKNIRKLVIEEVIAGNIGC